MAATHNKMLAFFSPPQTRVKKERCESFWEVPSALYTPVPGTHTHTTNTHTTNTHAHKHTEPGLRIQGGLWRDGFVYSNEIKTLSAKQEREIQRTAKRHFLMHFALRNSSLKKKTVIRGSKELWRWARSRCPAGRHWPYAAAHLAGHTRPRRR